MQTDSFGSDQCTRAKSCVRTTDEFDSQKKCIAYKSAPLVNEPTYNLISKI